MTYAPAISEATPTGFRLSPQQRAAFAASGGAAVQCASVALEGDLDVRRLERALAQVVGAYEILRTRFVTAPGMSLPLMVVEDQLTVPVVRCDFSALGPGHRDGVLERLAHDLASAAPLPDRLPLVDLTLCRLGEGHHRLWIRLSALVSDEAGIERLVAALAAAYAGTSEPDEPLQIVDLADWQNELLEGEEGAEGRARWRDAPSPAILEGCDLAHQASSSSRSDGARVIALDAGIAVQLEAVSEKLGLPIEALLLSAWGIVLGRLAERRDVAVAVRCDGRSQEMLQGVIGPLTKSPPVALGWPDDLPFARAAAMVAEALAEVRAWQEYFDPCHGTGDPAGGCSPGFSYLDCTARSAGGGLAWSIEKVVEAGSPHDLSLAAVRTAAGVELALRYRRAGIDARRVDQLAAWLAHLLAEAVAGPEARLGDLQLRSAEQRTSDDQAHNATERRFGYRDVWSRFAATAAAVPERTALTADEGALTFGDLAGRCHRLARHLRAHGAGPEARIAICLPRSTDLVVAVLATLESGAAFVPLDASYPEERLRFMLDDANASVLVTRGSLGLDLGAPCPRIDLDRAAAAIAAESPCPLSLAPPPPEALAYVIYTSGSTGRPKGVLIPQGSISNHLDWLQEVYRLGAEDRALLKTPLSFDVGVRELLWPLTSGVPLVVASASGPQDPAYLAALAASRGITVLNFVPTLLRAFLDQPAARGCTQLRRIISGGEALDGALRDRHRACLAAPLHNHYGPTETTITATAWTCGERDSGPQVPIGRPLANVRAHVVDRALHLVADGIAGELTIGGSGLGRGYHRRPALTAERFVPDPFGGRSGARLYRTGDRVRRRPGGELAFLGRLDEQVKVRGLRIELGEIESVLAEHPEVGQVALTTFAHGGDTALAAFVVPVAAPPAVEALRQFLEARLPTFMVPSCFVAIDELPRTPSGKVDRQTLARAAAGDIELGSRLGEAVDRDTGFEAPVGPIEEIVAGIWTSLLGLDRPVGRDDDFFALGGHSLLGTRVIARVREACSAEVPLGLIFEAPRLADLAARIARLRSGEAPADEPIGLVSRGSDLPLSSAQQRLWFLDRLDPGSAAYNLPAAARLSGRLDPALLSSVIDEVVRRHEILRTVFPAVGGLPVQRIHPWRPVRIPVVDLGGIEAEAAEAEAHRLATRDARRPFDLETGPLMRTVLLRLETCEHVLVATAHHIVSDGWSRGVLVRELVALYEAFAEGRPSPLPPLGVQYADYAHWQRQHQAAVEAADLAYWRGQLSGGDEPLALPFDRPRREVQRSRGRRCPVAIEPSLYHRLRQLGRQRGATLFMVVMAAFQAVLWRYSRQPAIRVGTPISGRDHTAIEPLIGFFVNTLVISAETSGSLRFDRLLERVRAASLDAHAHQRLPLERLVEALEPVRDLGRAPLFQVVLALQNAPRERFVLPGLEIELIELDTLTAKFDLTLILDEREDALAGWIEYNTDLFDAGTVLRFRGHWSRVLEAACAAPETLLDALPMLGAGERQQLLEAAAPALAPCFPFAAHRRFAAQAARTPDAVAVEAGEVRLSYRELEARANRLAHALIVRGVGAETPVGLCLEPSAELVVAALGILKAGAAYVPLDPHYPAARLSFLIADSGTTLVVTETRLLALQPEPRPPVFCLDAEAARLAKLPDRAPAVEVEGQRAAYVIYTSGSTGVPKGVIVSHANLARLFTATEPWFGFGPEDVWTLFHSFAFDFSVWELWGPLLYGGRLVVVPEDTRRAPEALLALLARSGVTVFNATPSAFRQLTALVDGGRRGDDLALRLVIFGGEALSPASLKPWWKHDRRPRFVNMYGITETTVHVTFRPIRQADLGAQVSPIGGAIPDLALHVLDGGSQPAALGVAGEIHVGGAGVARGYLGRPRLTAERFVPDPFSPVPGQRLYRSGDLGRATPAGELVYLGRGDHQVKVRGFRIEPGEIEAVLLELEPVRAAAVVARDDGVGPRLVAYLVAAEGTAGTAAGDALAADTLRRHLEARLPAHMVPAAFVTLDSLPLTRHGKLDREALPAPGDERPWLEQAYVAPRPGAEEIVAAVWSRVLGVDRVGGEDNFFALGGDSILSIRAVAEARSRGVEISLQQLFQHQTVAAVARAAGRPETTGTTPSEPFSLISAAERAALPVDVEDAFPLSRLQAGMLQHQQLSPDEPPYHNVDSFHLRGSFDAAAFRRAVALIFERHGALRTSFDLDRDEAIQVVHRRVTPAALVSDLRTLTPAATQLAIERFVAAARRRPLDPARPPLLRFVVHLRDAETFQLTLIENHAILDGWSLHATLDELFAIYRALRDRDPVPPAEAETVAFRDFVALERDAAASVESRDFWRRYLEGHRVLEVPRWPGARGARPRVAIHRVAIAEDLSERLLAVARSLALPLKSVLLAAHLETLGCIAGEADVLTGLVSNGRPESEGGERVRGLFLNTLPLRLRLAPGSWASLAEACFEAERALLAHRRVPLPEIQASAGARRLFETSFNYVHFHVARPLLGGVEVLEAVIREATDFTLSTTCGRTVDDGRVFLQLAYDTARLPAVQIEALANLYRAALACLADDPAKPREATPRLTTALRHQMLVEWNERPSVAPGRRFDQRLADHALRTPDRVAVVCGDRRLDFATLDVHADRLAQRLRRAGVGAESRVGICLAPSVWLPVAILGVLRAGGAFVPLDPSHPDRRRRTLLADAGATVLLTDRATAAAAVLPTLVIDDPDRPLDGDRTPARPAMAFHDEQAAYVLYTSGSTGHPKGVVVSHRALGHYLDWCRQAYAVEGEGRVPVHSSIAFDLTVTALLAPLAAGRPVELLPARIGAEALTVSLRSGPACNLVKLTPAHLELLALELDPPAAAAAIRALVIGGEALYGEPLRFWRRNAPSTRLINEYGPTEATVGCAYYELPAGPVADGPVPIGRAIAGMRLIAVGPGFQAAPIGAVGELVIGGAGLARGYLGRPGSTAASFVPDPFGPLPGGRLYRSGDLVRWLPGGDLVFLGRRDHQIKLRGVRVEPGEVIAALREHPEVRDAHALVTDDAGGGRLVAFAAVTGASTSHRLREFLRQRLPPALVPAEIVTVDALPLTENGKVDRAALLRALSSVAPAGGAPRTPVEALLADAWRDLLGAERIGLEDDFFALGGHSLLAGRLSARIGEAFGVELPLATLFDAPTLEAQAAAIEAALRGGLRLPPIVPVPSDRPLPLSFAQQRLWFLAELDPESPAYNVQLAVRLRGTLRPSALVHAFDAVVRRHESLRTTFTELEGVPRQVVGPAAGGILRLVDLSSLPPAMRTGAARQVAGEVADRPFDLARGPLLRAQLLLLDADGADAVLALTLHHIVCDGWALPRLVTELAAFYRAAVAGEPVRLPPLSVQVADFAAWQRRVLTDERLEAQLAYWRERLAGDLRRLRLPFRRSPGPGDGARHRDGSVAFKVSAASSAALLDLARRHRVTPFMACLAVFKTLLYRLSGETEVVVGTDFANRVRAEIEPLIGFFVNLLVLRTDLGGGPRISELLNRVRETALGAYAHHEVPFERLVEVLAPERSLDGQAPLFRYLFVFGGPPPSASLPGVALEPFASGRETARFELGLFMHETELGFAGSWIYQSAHYRRSDIELLSRQLVDLFEQFARMPDARLEDLDLYTSSVDETKGNAMPGQEARLRPSAFKRVKPKMISVPQGDLVRTGSLDGSVPPFPLVIEPAVDGLDPCGWGAANRSMLEDAVSRHGALLFRGFDLGGVPGFEAFVASICPTLFGDYGDLPQADEGQKVYHSTPYPKTKTILFHNESSHTHQWPLRQFFYCVLPAQSGGETPIVDCRRLYRVLDPAVRDRFARLGLIYQRNFTEGLDVSWQGFFRTDSKDEVETHCRRHGIEVSWQGERLRTRQRAPAVAFHPRTGESLFFNQILLHHISCMEPEVRASLATLFDEDSLPRNVYYGDGTPIEDALVEEILELYWRESVSFPWQAGDALMVDNMLVAHARNPFEGPRKIAVAMGEMFQQAELGPAATAS